MASTMILQTDRLVLRRQVIEDLDDLWSLYGDPDITRFIPDAPRSREEAREELEWHMHGHPRNPQLGLWATIHKPSGAFIGRCGLLPWAIEGQPEVEVAYTIARAYWGQGLATEAAHAILRHGFDSLRLTRLICLIDPDNIASQRVAEKIGMHFEKRVAEYEGDGTPFFVYSAMSPSTRTGAR